MAYASFTSPAGINETAGDAHTYKQARQTPGKQMPHAVVIVSSTLLTPPPLKILVFQIFFDKITLVELVLHAVASVESWRMNTAAPMRAWWCFGCLII